MLLGSDIGGDVIGLVAVITIFGVPPFVWLLARIMRHREAMATLQHGIPPTVDPAAAGAYYARMSGQPAAGPRPAGYSAYAIQCQLRKGITLVAVGLALVVGLSTMGFGPWLVAGLIPLFIGVAQVGLAWLAGGNAMPIPPEARTGGPVPGAPPSGAPFDSSYTYRPSGSTQELYPPPKPPEPR
ncbi:MAG: hypothetical protein ACREM8_09685 [Vulcanimicrobiaceae bacterium]